MNRVKCVMRVRTAVILQTFEHHHSIISGDSIPHRTTDISLPHELQDVPNVLQTSFSIPWGLLARETAALSRCIPLGVAPEGAIKRIAVSSRPEFGDMPLHLD